VGLLVTVVPISLVGLYAITKSDRELKGTVGSHFKLFAEYTARGVSQIVHDRVVLAGTIATEQSVVDAVQAANRRYEGMSEEAISARINGIEEAWNARNSPPVLREVLSSDAATRLRRFQEIDPRFLRITVTDARGATVAATHKTLDYFQADEDYWQSISAEGRGAISLTDILYDDVTKTSYIGVGVPVLDEGTNRFLGTVDALVDVSNLIRSVEQPSLQLHTTLVKGDGTVISAPEADLSMNLKSEEFAAVRDSLQTITGRQTGYLITEIPKVGLTLIGFADTGLKEDYQNLGWVVLVSQDANEAFASIRFVGRLTGFLALLGLAMVVFVAMYFSMHRREAYEDRHPMGDAEEPKPKNA
jgi:hypothetical protein